LIKANVLTTTLRYGSASEALRTALYKSEYYYYYYKDN